MIFFQSDEKKTCKKPLYFNIFERFFSKKTIKNSLRIKLLEIKKHYDKII